MSRHRAEPDGDAAALSSSERSSDTGPLFLGQDSWPPPHPSPRNGSPASRSAERGDYGLGPPDGHGAVLDGHTADPVEHRPAARPPDDNPGSENLPTDNPHDVQPRDEHLHGEHPHDEHPHDPQLHGEHPHDEHPHDPQLHGEHPHDEHPHDLGLLAAPAADKRPRRGRRSRAGGGGRRPLGVLISLLVIGALVTGIFFGGKAIVGLLATEPAADFSGQGTGMVEVEIPRGASTSAIAQVLLDSDVIASTAAFLEAANGNPDAMTIQPGMYQMRSQMSGAAALALLLDPATRQVSGLTIPEGYTVARTLASLAEQTGLPLTDFETAAAAPAQLGVPAWGNGQLEGFLYPNTYEIGPDDTAVQILTTMVAQFNEVATQTGLEADAAALGRTPYELLTLASLVQSEVTVEAERPMVARVIYNRLEQSIPLGIDAASRYEAELNGEDPAQIDYTADSPYNTRTRQGLPPTPISSPGEPSIVGALEPAEGTWLYYVLQDSDGNHLFTDNYEEFLAAKAACEAAGLGCG